MTKHKVKESLGDNFVSGPERANFTCVKFCNHTNEDKKDVLEFFSMPLKAFLKIRQVNHSRVTLA